MLKDHAILTESNNRSLPVIESREELKSSIKESVVCFRHAESFNNPSLGLVHLRRRPI